MNVYCISVDYIFKNYSTGFEENFKLFLEVSGKLRE